MSRVRTAIAATATLVAGLAIAHVATDGFAAYTLESARRLQALRSPVAVGALALDRAEGDRVALADMPGRVLLVDFVYTQCTTYCTALGSIYARLQDRLRDEIATGDVRLVSVSFDAARDTPDALNRYRARHAVRTDGWDVGTPAPVAQLPRWLAEFGVVVIPDGVGGYAHNAAVHVVGPERKLIAILDANDSDAVIRTAREVLARRP
jgi:protein SCO1/2